MKLDTENETNLKQVTINSLRKFFFKQSKLFEEITYIKTQLTELIKDKVKIIYSRKIVMKNHQ